MHIGLIMILLGINIMLIGIGYYQMDVIEKDK